MLIHRIIKPFIDALELVYNNYDFDLLKFTYLTKIEIISILISLVNKAI